MANNNKELLTKAYILKNQGKSKQQVLDILHKETVIKSLDSNQTIKAVRQLQNITQLVDGISEDFKTDLRIQMNKLLNLPQYTDMKVVIKDNVRTYTYKTSEFDFTIVDTIKDNDVIDSKYDLTFTGTIEKVSMKGGSDLDIYLKNIKYTAGGTEITSLFYLVRFVCMGVIKTGDSSPVVLLRGINDLFPGFVHQVELTDSDYFDAVKSISPESVIKLNRYDVAQSYMI